MRRYNQRQPQPMHDPNNVPGQVRSMVQSGGPQGQGGMRPRPPQAQNMIREQQRQNGYQGPPQQGGGVLQGPGGFANDPNARRNDPNDRVSGPHPVQPPNGRQDWGNTGRPGFNQLENQGQQGGNGGGKPGNNGRNDDPRFQQMMAEYQQRIAAGNSGNHFLRQHENFANHMGRIAGGQQYNPGADRFTDQQVQAQKQWMLQNGMGREAWGDQPGGAEGRFFQQEFNQARNDPRFQNFMQNQGMQDQMGRYMTPSGVYSQPPGVQQDTQGQAQGGQPQGQPATQGQGTALQQQMQSQQGLQQQLQGQGPTQGQPQGQPMQQQAGAGPIGGGQGSGSGGTTGAGSGNRPPGNGGGNGGGQDPAAGRNYLYSPEFEQERRGMQHQLTQELANIGISRDQIPSMVNMIQTRLDNKYTMDRSNVDEQMGDRGFGDSSVRNDAQAGAYHDYFQGYHDEMGNIRDQYGDLGMREQGSKSDFNNSIREMLREMASRQSQDPRSAADRSGGNTAPRRRGNKKNKGNRRGKN